MLCFDWEKMKWYYHLLARRPYLVVTSIAVYCCACIIVSVILKGLPDFRDPSLGFETRGTEIGKRLVAWHNLMQESEGRGGLVSNPDDLLQKRQYELSLFKRKSKRRKHKRRKHEQMMRRLETENDTTTPTIFNDKYLGDSGVFRDYEITNDSSAVQHSETVEYGHNTTYVDEDAHRERVQIKKSTWRLLKQAATLPTSAWGDDETRFPIEGYFCDSSPRKEYSHFVVQRIGPNATDSLFDLNSLLAMCQLQQQIASVESYSAYCESELLGSKCCRPWSLPNYVALLANKSSCFDINMDDVMAMQTLLLRCFDYYHNSKLDQSCIQPIIRCQAPKECTRHNIVFNVLHFLADVNFIKPNDSNVFLHYAMIFVPVAQSNKTLQLFHEWEEVELNNEIVEVFAMDLGLENELFNELLITEVWLVTLGGMFVLACVWLYTGSAFITVMSCCAVFFSLGLAYFIYMLVFEFAFFPYMNLLAVVVIIGIGADDVFLFLKIWQCVLAERFTKTTTSSSEQEYTETMENLMSLTMRHAAASMFVTSLTTAGAFYASYSSYITAIKCFGVFAGTVVVCNYFLMITWLPASVCIMERLFASSMTACHQHLFRKMIHACKKSISRFSQYFEQAIIHSVMSYAYIWIVIFSALGLCSAFIVFWYPGLQLPEQSHFQLFVSQHPFERYNSRLRQEFGFEKKLQLYDHFKMHMGFVWGVLAIDDGDHTNPHSYGNIHYDNNLNISSKAAQLWVLKFCQNIRGQPFYEPTLGFLLPNCFIENFIEFMKRRCVDDMDSARSNHTPCCEAEFPFDPHIFEICLPHSISSLYATPNFFQPGVAGPKFATLDHREHGDGEDEGDKNLTTTTIVVKALVIEFESNLTYTTIYTDVKHFYDTVEQWFQLQLKTAPIELQNGWFVSELKFFNVQDTLSHDTIFAIGLAMAVSLVVLLCFTLNILVSLYAVITVSLTIFAVVAVLILLGWKLNILESIAVSTAIGLSVDFSLHYGIHYRLAPTKERLAATEFALSRIIGPTVMAAITTAIAGGIMITSSILPYIQIGIFLVVIMIISWFYATFLLMSLLKVAGPQHGFMQLKMPKWRKCHNSNGNKFYERNPSQIIASEQLLTPTSSAIVELANSETHELESLNSSSLIKIISGTECAHTMPIQSIDLEHSFQAPNECKYQQDESNPSVSEHAN